MRSRRHARPRTLGSARVVVPILLGSLVLLGGGALAAHRYNALLDDRILPGVRVAGVDVGGMTRDQAGAAVEEVADEALSRMVEVRAGQRTWHVSPAELGTTTNVEARVDQALAMDDGMAWPVRVFRHLFDREVDDALELEYTIDEGSLQRFVEIVARSVNVSPTNAAVELVDGEIEITRPEQGWQVRMRAAREALSAALAGESAVAEFALRALRPEVTSKDLGHTIVVRISENRLYLYDGLKLAKTYPVATGQPSFPTPQGNWTIVNKAANPSWTNPDPKGWGKDLPPYIPPGPGNPLGTRALYLDAPGIRIHGTYASGSIGTYASHGCIRMHLHDVEELFEIVDVGTPAYVYW